MHKLNELVELAERADRVANLMDGVNPHDILAIAEAFRALAHSLKDANACVEAAKQEIVDLEQRAEAADAKLAELKRQEPYGWLVGLPGRIPVFTMDYRNVEQAIAAGGYQIIPIYTQ
ncbi:hypothetical protein, partial [Bacillus altitudinis]|uniref:hypothetical protein n=1 Tax=Bacillus altitudinis TaxID=293387 RepID=UPI0036735CE4